MERLKLLEFWGYRGAMTVGNRTILPRGSVVELEIALFVAADQRSENKCTFKVQDFDINIRYITLTDSSCIIGDEVEKREATAKNCTYDDTIVSLD